MNKKSSKYNLKNNRPILLFPLVSKIIEKTIHNESNNTLIKMAYFISIDLVFPQIVERILTLYNLQVLIWEEWTMTFRLITQIRDKSQNFYFYDTLDHIVLLQEMELIGSKKSVIKRFEKFLLTSWNFWWDWNMSFQILD